MGPAPAMYEEIVCDENGLTERIQVSLIAHAVQGDRRPRKRCAIVDAIAPGAVSAASARSMQHLAICHFHWM